MIAFKDIPIEEKLKWKKLLRFKLFSIGLSIAQFAKNNGWHAYEVHRALGSPGTITPRIEWIYKQILSYIKRRGISREKLTDQRFKCNRKG